MNQRTRGTEAFDLEEWLESVRGKTIEVTDWDAEDKHRPDVLDSRGAGPALHPAEPRRCPECSVDRMLVASSRYESGECPECGWSPGPE